LPIGTIFADRLAYLASAAGCGLLVETAFLIKNKTYRRGILNLVSICFAVLCAGHIANWQSNYTLFKSEVEKSPRNSLAHRVYGKELLLREEIPEAINHLNIALELYPYCLKPRKLLAIAHFEKKDYQQAAAWARRYLQHVPTDEHSKRILECSESFQMQAQKDNCEGVLSAYRSYVRSYKEGEVRFINN
jgi:tetratricopeptide (TPR) repeat protein